MLTVDSRTLVESHRSSIFLSSINSGATIYGNGRRGAGTFKTIEEYPFEDIKRRKKEDAIVELAVDYAVKDIAKSTVKVEEWTDGRPTMTIWQK